MEKADYLFVDQLAVDAQIGVTETERSHSQPLLISCKLFVDTRPAASSNQLGDSVDYFAVSQEVRRFVAGQSWILLENLAEQLVRRCFELFELRAIRLKIEKPRAISGAKTAGIEIFRENF